MSRFGRARHLSAGGGRRGSPEVGGASMRRLRRLALVGAILLGGFFGATPADAVAASPAVASVAHADRHVVTAPDLLADPAGSTTTVAPPPPIDVTPSSAGMPGPPLPRKPPG